MINITGLKYVQLKQIDDYDIKFFPPFNSNNFHIESICFISINFEMVGLAIVIILKGLDILALLYFSSSFSTNYPVDDANLYYKIICEVFLL